MLNSNFNANRIIILENDIKLSCVLGAVLDSLNKWMLDSVSYLEEQKRGKHFISFEGRSLSLITITASLDKEYLIHFMSDCSGDYPDLNSGVMVLDFYSPGIPKELIEKVREDLEDDFFILS